VKNSDSLSYGHCLYDSLVPAEYVSLQSIIYEVQQQQGEIRNLKIRDKKKLGVNSPAWMLRQIWKYPETAVIKLQTWVDKEPIDKQMVTKINEMKEEDALWYLRKIQTKPIPSTPINGAYREFAIPLVMEMLDTEEGFEIEALLDSRCTTSCISTQIVEEKGINTIKLPRGILVRNADRTENVEGKITHLAWMKVSIGSHEEVMEFAVSGLGKKDILGHDWLCVHNPEIDWMRKQLQFTRCPGSCYPESEVIKPEDEGEQFRKSEGDVLLAIDINKPELQLFSQEIRAKWGSPWKLLSPIKTKTKTFPRSTSSIEKSSKRKHSMYYHLKEDGIMR
jgi:hypothetical protein